MQNNIVKLKHHLQIEEDESLIYETYIAKVKGKNHPDQIVETASLASVELPKPSYAHGLPQKLVDEGMLSSAQLETVIYANMRFRQTIEDGESSQTNIQLE